MEKRGTVIGCDENGMPLDPASHWFKDNHYQYTSKGDCHLKLLYSNDIDSHLRGRGGSKVQNLEPK